MYDPSTPAGYEMMNSLVTGSICTGGIGPRLAPKAWYATEGLGVQAVGDDR